MQQSPQLASDKPNADNQQYIQIGTVCEGNYNDCNIINNGDGSQIPQYTKWFTSPCDICQLTCLVFEFVACHYCYIAKQYNMLRYRDNSINYLHCCGIFTLDAMMPTLGTSLGTLYNYDLMTTQYNLSDNKLFDINVCICALFCPQCLTLQMYREMNMRGDTTGTFCGTSMPYSMTKQNGIPRIHTIA